MYLIKTPLFVQNLFPNFTWRIPTADKRLFLTFDDGPHPEITLEVHISNGLPGFTLVGLPDTSVREARERVRSALLSSGLDFPQRRITVNLAPADLPKESARFDLAIAMGILSASGRIERARLESHEFLAELGLSGDLRSTSGVLGAALKARGHGRTLVVAPADADVATKAPGVRILAPSSLSELVAHFDGFRPLAPCQLEPARRCSRVA